MKTEKIEIWVDKPEIIKEGFNKGYYANPRDNEFSWDAHKSASLKYKVTLEIEMPEREGTFTESEIDRFANKLVHWDGDTREWIDKLFNGDFKE